MIAVHGDRVSGLDASLCTFMGIEFFPLSPRPEHVNLFDIAHALARQCRYAGHVATEHYSLAEHAVLVSTLVPPEDALWGLLYNAHKAYLPLPDAIERVFPAYQAACERLRSVIVRRFGLPAEEPSSIREAAERLRLTEQRAFFKNRPRYDRPSAAARVCRAIEAVQPDLEPYAIPIVGLAPSLAERAFLQRFHALTGKPPHDGALGAALPGGTR